MHDNSKPTRMNENNKNNYLVRASKQSKCPDLYLLRTFLTQEKLTNINIYVIFFHKKACSS